MSAHTDITAVKTSLPITEDYIQLVLLLSEKGTDFHSGGAYISKDGEIIDIESDTQSGDVLIYDSSTIHGVMDIDPHLPLDISKGIGRYVAMATIYSKM